MYKDTEADADTDNDDVTAAELAEEEADRSPDTDGRRKRRSIVASDPKKVWQMRMYAYGKHK